jgi:SAM-dependent methyltransferase
MKPYEAHEFAYQRMEKEGIGSWGENSGGPAIEPGYERFLFDSYERPWFPKQGRVMELGCGTGSIIRLIANHAEARLQVDPQTAVSVSKKHDHRSEQGFSGVGIDAAETSLRMARERTRGLDLEFVTDDVVTMDPDRYGKFDVVIDGACLLCLTDEADRMAMLRNAKELLSDRGIFVLLTMCGPVDEAGFQKQYPDQIIADDLAKAKKPLENGTFSESFAGPAMLRIWYPHRGKREYDGARTIDGQVYVPGRALPDRESLMAELNAAGFDPVQVEQVESTPEDPVGSLMVCSKKG